MAKRITQEEFEARIIEIFPTAEFKILQYRTISGPCQIKCLKCGKIRKVEKASTVLKNKFCCENEDRVETAIRRLDDTEDFQFIKYLKGEDQILVKHDKCGMVFKRRSSLIIKSPNHCPYCSDNTGLALTIQQTQEQINKEFNDSIKLLEYNAVRSQNTYKCLKCGLIFKQTQKNLLASRGCPKCDRFKSKGEKKIAQILQQNNIYYKEQVSFDDLSDGRQRFDFAIYKDKEMTQLNYLIECQGEQHYIDKTDIFQDSLEVVQERDERKRKYCKSKNIPLYEIEYFDGHLNNLNILPFYKKDN